MTAGNILFWQKLAVIKIIASTLSLAIVRALCYNVKKYFLEVVII